MDYPFEHADFTGRSLALRVSKWLGAVKLVVDGSEVRPSWRKFTVLDNQGRPRVFQVQMGYVDPVPALLLDGTSITVVPPLRWYEYAWTGLPSLLLFVGGGLGALIGVLAAFANTRIFRSGRGAVARYLFAGLTTVGAVGAYFVAALGLRMVILLVAPASKLSLDFIAQATNAELPMAVDDETEWVRMEALEGVLASHFRLKNIRTDETPAAVQPDVLRSSVTAGACADSESRGRFLDRGVVLRYIYTDATGNPVTRFDVAATDCVATDAPTPGTLRSTLEGGADNEPAIRRGD